MIAEDRSRLLDLQRVRLAQVQGQLAALDRAILASVAEDMDQRDSVKPATRRERTQPFAYAGDGRAQRHEREPAFPTRPATKPSAEDIARANAYLRRLGVPEGLL